MKKSTLCWLLNDKERLTSDRLKRYVYGGTSDPNNCGLPSTPIYKQDYFKKGDYIIVNMNGGFALGEILNFQRCNQKTLKSKRFSKRTCGSSTNEIGLLANAWYLIDENGSLTKMISSDYIAADNYVYHVRPEFFNLETLEIFKDIVETLYNDLIDEN